MKWIHEEAWNNEGKAPSSQKIEKMIKRHGFKELCNESAWGFDVENAKVNAVRYIPAIENLYEDDNFLEDYDEVWHEHPESAKIYIVDESARAHRYKDELAPVFVIDEEEIRELRLIIKKRKAKLIHFLRREKNH